MIVRVNEYKTLTKRISWECKCKLMVEMVMEIKSGITTNNGMNLKICENIMLVKEILFGILLLVVVKMVNI